MTVARAVKTRGVKGELVAELLTDFPDRFERISKLVAIAPDGNQRTVELEDYWHHQSRVVLKFAGFDDIEAAGSLVGNEFAVPESERVELPAGHFYDWEIHGAVVETVAGDKIGNVLEVMRVGGDVEMLVVENDKGHDHLIPMVQTIVVNVNVKQKRIRIDPPEGLLEL